MPGFDKPIDEPKNDDTEEMALYLEPRYVSKDSGVINCNGSVQVADAGMSCISASFDEACQITQCIYAATITVEGYNLAGHCKTTVLDTDATSATHAITNG